MMDSQLATTEKMQKTILVSAYREFSIRYLLYTDILSVLKEELQTIVILVKDVDVEYYRERFLDPKIIVEPVEYQTSLKVLKGSAVSRFFILFRKIISGRDRKMINSTDESRVTLYRKEFQQKGFIQRSLFAMLVGIAYIARRSRRVRRMVARLESWIYPGRHYDKYIEKYRPSLIVTSSLGYMIDPYLMRSAKRYGVKTVSVIHSWDNTSTKDYRGADPDHVVVWNEIMRNEAHVFHDVSLDKIFLGGIAHWDDYFRENAGASESKQVLFKELGLNQCRPMIYYGTSSPKTNPDTFEIISELGNAIERGHFEARPQLLVRLHPSYLWATGADNVSYYDLFKDQIYYLSQKYLGNLIFDAPQMPRIPGGVDMPKEDLIRHMNILKHADILLTEYSTLMIEAAIFDVPIINVGYGNFRDTKTPVSSYAEGYTHIKRVLSTGACDNAYSFDQLCRLINRSLDDRGKGKREREALVTQEVTVHRTDAGRTIGKYLVNLCDFPPPPPVRFQ